jgi:hypothetical protein
LHGEALQGGTVVHLDIVPPAYLWTGDTAPHTDPTHWRVYADGTLIARIERDEDVGPALLPLLAARTYARACCPTYNAETDR